MTHGIIHDNALPKLQQATDTKTMAGAFETFFNRQYPDLALSVRDCEISRIKYKPGNACNITYRLSGQDRECRPYVQWIYAKMLANGDSHEQVREKAPLQWPGCDFWKPVSSWQEMDMELHAFPYDAKMPYLGKLLEAEFIKQQVEKNLRGFGLTGSWKCREVHCQKIKYMPTRRCVLRYNLLMEDAAKNLRQIEFYSKTYNSSNSRYVYNVLSAVCANPACKDGTLNIPAPIANLNSVNTLWQFAWDGIKFGAVMRKRGWAELPNSGFMPKIAKMLAALHQIEITSMALSDGPAPAEVIENAYGDAEDISQFQPEKESTVMEVARSLKRLAPEATKHATAATIHGSFKVAQLLCREHELALVDFDSISRGDPLFDVAEFFASILYLIVSDSVPTVPIISSVDSFWSVYQQHVPWDCDRRRLAWYLVAFLMGKMHSSLKRSETTAIENMPLAYGLIEEWLEIARGTTPKEGAAHD